MRGYICFNVFRRRPIYFNKRHFVASKMINDIEAGYYHNCHRTLKCYTHNGTYFVIDACFLFHSNITLNISHKPIKTTKDTKRFIDQKNPKVIFMIILLLFDCRLAFMT